KFITVFLHSCQEPGYRLHKSIIVHHSVPLVSFQPGPGFSIMLCKDQSVRVSLLHIPTKFSPKLMIVLIAVSQVCRNVKTPPVHIIGGRNPFSGNTHNIIIESGRLFIIQFWQSVMSPPTVVELVIGPAILIVKAEKSTVRTVLRYISPLLISCLILVNLLSVQPFIK